MITRTAFNRLNHNGQLNPREPDVLYVAVRLPVMWRNK